MTAVTQYPTYRLCIVLGMITINSSVLHAQEDESEAPAGNQADRRGFPPEQSLIWINAAAGAEGCYPPDGPDAVVPQERLAHAGSDFPEGAVGWTTFSSGGA